MTVTLTNTNVTLTEWKPIQIHLKFGFICLSGRPGARRSLHDCAVCLSQ